jgi:hypothetical protein
LDSDYTQLIDVVGYVQSIRLKSATVEPLGSIHCSVLSKLAPATTKAVGSVELDVVRSG